MKQNNYNNAFERLKCYFTKFPKTKPLRSGQTLHGTNAPSVCPLFGGFTVYVKYKP